MSNDKQAQLLQDISAIAKKALDDVQSATESDWAGILSDGLEDIIELCEREQGESNQAITSRVPD